MKMNLICGVSALAGVLLLAGAADAAGMLTAKNGMTLYVFDNDTGGTSSCYMTVLSVGRPTSGRRALKWRRAGP